MAFRQRREALRAILSGSSCIRPGSVYDAISIRIAEDLGFEVGMFGGSVASLAVLGDPDITLITLTELAEQMRRMSRAAALPVLVDADHGYGNALNVRRTVQELEAAGAAGLTIEDTLLPQAFGETKTQLISLEEGVGKMKAAVDGRGDPSLVDPRAHRALPRSPRSTTPSCAPSLSRDRRRRVVLHRHEVARRARDDFGGTRLPIVLGGAPEEMIDLDCLAGQRVGLRCRAMRRLPPRRRRSTRRLRHCVRARAPRQLKGLASGDLTNRVTREADAKARLAAFFGHKK